MVTLKTWVYQVHVVQKYVPFTVKHTRKNNLLIGTFCHLSCPQQGLCWCGLLVPLMNIITD